MEDVARSEQEGSVVEGSFDTRYNVFPAPTLMVSDEVSSYAA